MESCKVLISIALLVACVYAVPAEQEQLPFQHPQPNLPQPGSLPLGPLEKGIAPGPNREKKQALYPYAYSAYPYSAYPYAAYPYAAYPYSYSYQYADDGKYYPGKYEKPYYRAGYPYYPYSYYY